MEYLSRPSIFVMVSTAAKKVRFPRKSLQHIEGDAESSRGPYGRPDWAQLEKLVKKAEVCCLCINVVLNTTYKYTNILDSLDCITREPRSYTPFLEMRIGLASKY